MTRREKFSFLYGGNTPTLYTLIKERGNKNGRNE
nr:MAG TPA: hypothetical protein [Caudoviricetes sp.]